VAPRSFDQRFLVRTGTGAGFRAVPAAISRSVPAIATSTSNIRAVLLRTFQCIRGAYFLARW
jgi:hypothetical protein